VKPSWRWQPGSLKIQYRELQCADLMKVNQASLPKHPSTHVSAASRNLFGCWEGVLLLEDLPVGLRMLMVSWLGACFLWRTVKAAGNSSLWNKTILAL